MECLHEPYNVCDGQLLILQNNNRIFFAVLMNYRKSAFCSAKTFEGEFNMENFHTASISRIVEHAIMRAEE